MGSGVQEAKVLTTQRLEDGEQRLVLCAHLDSTGWVSAGPWFERDHAIFAMRGIPAA
jgi:hypothetical protein